MTLEKMYIVNSVFISYYELKEKKQSYLLLSSRKSIYHSLIQNFHQLVLDYSRFFQISKALL